MTRTTVPDELTDPKEQALDDVLHWIWSWRLQRERLAATTMAQSGGPDPVSSRRSFSHASYDEHVLVVAGWNVARALKQAEALFPSIRSLGQGDALRLLRNLYEHWDEQRRAFQNPPVEKARSGKEFSDQYPQGRPWSITYAAGDWLLGGVVSARAITESLVQEESEALRLEGELRKSTQDSGAA